MLEERIGLFLVFGMVGSGLLLFGVLIRLGKIRYWWASPYYAAGQEPFVTLPAGLMLSLWAIATLFPQQEARRTLFIIGGGFVVLAMVFLLVQPRFLKPAWLQWLEDNHKRHIPILRKEAREMGVFQWAGRVRTQAGLEQWVKEVKHKHNLFP
jgi:drug/metabolite transporter superfamily protein YnfA